MKHDIALRYSVDGAASAVLEVVPQHYNRALVEIQLQPENYLPGPTPAATTAVDEEAKSVKAEKRKKAMEETAKRAAKEGGAAGPQARRKAPSKLSRAVYDDDSAVYTAYLRVEPVHLLMLSDFCYAHDTAGKVWRAPKSSPMLAGGKYGWASPLFSSFRLTTDAGSVRLGASLEDPGPSSFASSLRDRLSITTVHLPMVPSALDDEDAWLKVAPLPEHQVALKSAELRQWLHYLAHTSLKDGRVDMPAKLRTHRIFRKSVEMAEDLLRTTSDSSYSEKEVTDLALYFEREKEEERAAAAEREAAGAQREAAAAEREVTLRAAWEEERTAAAKREAAAAERELTLRAELERLTRSGTGAP